MAPPKMNKRVRFPRAGTQVNDSYVGPDGQVTVDNQRRELRLHDGRKAGGWIIPNLTNLRKMFLSADVEMGQLAFPIESVGLLTRTSDKVYQLRVLQAADGMEVENETGVEGNPKVRLPKRLRQTSVAIADANLAIENGFYVVAKGANSNLPDVWKTTSNVALEVMTHEGEQGGALIQIARALQVADADVYTRRRVDNAWGAWGKKADPVIPTLPTQGNYTMLAQGVDDVKRLWSASDISQLVRNLGLGSIQYIDAANAAVNKLYNQLFALAGSGANTSTQTFGPFNMATGDRFEIVASATAIKSAAGDSQTAQIAIEKNDLTWDIIGSIVVTTLANEEAKTVSVTARFIKTANGYQTADENWTVLGTVVATLTGRMRVTIGTQDQAGARAARWR